LLSTPAAWTTTLPVVAPDGTDTAMLVALHVVTEAGVAKNFTVLLPCVAPKFEPATVTAAPTAPVVGERRCHGPAPDVGDRLVMLGAANAAAGITMAKASVTRRARRACNPFDRMILVLSFRSVRHEAKGHQRRLQQQTRRTFHSFWLLSDEHVHENFTTSAIDNRRRD
jgi:hypothetical protein